MLGGLCGVQPDTETQQQLPIIGIVSHDEHIART